MKRKEPSLEVLKKNRKTSIFSTGSRNTSLKHATVRSPTLLSSANSISKKSTSISRPKTKKSTPLAIMRKSTHKAMNLNKIKSKFLLKKKEKALQEKVDKLASEQKYYRKYLVCMHLFKTGLLKLAYYYYSQRHKKALKKSFVLLLKTDMISALKIDITKENVDSTAVKNFISEYDREKLSKPNFNSCKKDEKQLINSHKNIDLIEQLSNENSSDTGRSSPVAKSRLKVSRGHRATLSQPILQLNTRADSKINNNLGSYHFVRKPPLASGQRSKKLILPKIKSRENITKVLSPPARTIGGVVSSKKLIRKNKKKLKLKYE